MTGSPRSKPVGMKRLHPSGEDFGIRAKRRTMEDLIGPPAAPRKAVTFGSLCITECARSVNTSAVPHDGPPVGLSHDILGRSLRRVDSFEEEREGHRILVRIFRSCGGRGT